MKTHNCLAVGLVCTMLAATATAGDATPPTDWRETARSDIETGYRLMHENHPGMVDPRNPAFPGELEEARRRALALVPGVESYAGYRAALGAFNAVLNDGHAEFAVAWDEFIDWPGFVAAWRGGELRVFESTVEVPAKGDRIVACDGEPVRRLVERNVLPFHNRRDGGGAWWQLAPWLFLDFDNPFIERPRKCTFETPAGRRRHSRLAWSAVASQSVRELRRAEANGDRLPVGLAERGRGIFWLALQTFQPNEEERQLYQRMFADLDARHAELLRARAVVLDLRYNNGGSSQWPDDTAAHLWGASAVEQTSDAYFKGVEVWWRATAGHAARIEDYAREQRERGDVENAASMADLAAALRAAQLAGEPFVVRPVGSSGHAAPASAPAPLGVAVYVVVPPHCASACLDALDLFTRFPDVTLIGAPSSTDSLYIDVRSETLPSGKARLVIPMKVWVNRPRADGEAYTPAIEVTELDWSTETFLKHIERDLQTRAGQPTRRADRLPH